MQKFSFLCLKFFVIFEKFFEIREGSEDAFILLFTLKLINKALD
jgi:hypothetical protein